MAVINLAGEINAVRERLWEYLKHSDFAQNLIPDHLQEAVWSYPNAGGKYLRPCLLLWACKALGGKEEEALPAAAAVEIFHTWTLVHDDILDRDCRRRGRPTVHEEFRLKGEKQLELGDFAAHYGESMAILAGDLQHGWAVILLSEICGRQSPALALSLIKELEGKVLTELIEGEALDMQLSQFPLEKIAEAEILRVIEKKTAALISFSARAGGLLAKNAPGKDSQIEALAVFGHHTGLAFQLQDDILGLVGDKAVLGKAVGADIREGKRTLPLAYSWRKAPAEVRAKLEKVVGNSNAPVEEIAEACQLIEKLGGIEYTQKIAKQHFNMAIASLEKIEAGPYRQLLAELARLMIERSN